MHEELLQRRDDYPVLGRTTYLASHTLGAMHRGTPLALQRFSDLWAEHGVVAWEQWAPEVQRVADLVGSLIGAPPGTTVMRQNVADLLGDLVSCLDWQGPRNRVVTSSLEWPGSLHLWSQIHRWGGEAVVVPGAGLELDLQAMLDAIDERTLLVECSHVLFRTSSLNDVQPLIEKAHEVGALAVIDGYQAAGTVPVDVLALGADIYLGGSVKYLSGGPGNGWMYVREGLGLEPVTPGWFGQAKPFDFDPANHYAAGAARFMGGTSGVPAHYAAGPAYEALADIGVQRIRERSVSMTQPLLESALERGFTVRSPHDAARRGGHVTIDPGDSERVHDELHRQGFVVDHRPGVGIRVSPHFYNTLDEAMACLDAMEQLPVSAQRRGRETALDMLRTLAIIFAVVLPLWFFGQASPSDSKRIRPVDPTNALHDFAADTGAPIPTTPAGWIVNVATGTRGTVRVGYVIGEHFTEFAGGSGPAFLEDATGKGTDHGPVDVSGVTWRDYLSDDGHESLVRTVHGVTLVVGGVREDVTQAQLTKLAATVR